MQFLHEVLLVVSQGIVISMLYNCDTQFSWLRPVYPVLLIVRTYALYECNRKVAIFLSSIAIFGGILGGVSFWPRFTSQT